MKKLIILWMSVLVILVPTFLFAQKHKFNTGGAYISVISDTTGKPKARGILYYLTTDNNLYYPNGSNFIQVGTLTSGDSIFVKMLADTIGGASRDSTYFVSDVILRQNIIFEETSTYKTYYLNASGDTIITLDPTFGIVCSDSAYVDTLTSAVLRITGKAFIEDSLRVERTSLLKGTVTTSADIAVGTKAVVNDSLRVEETALIKGNVTMNANLDVDDSLDVGGILQVSPVQDSVAIIRKLTVTGNKSTENLFEVINDANGTAGDSAVTIASTGDLTVYGAPGILGVRNPANSNVIYVKSSASDNSVFSTGWGKHLIIYTTTAGGATNTNQMYFNSSGNIGFSTDDPDHTISISAATPIWSMWDSDVNLDVSTAAQQIDSAAVYIDASGNPKIGFAGTDGDASDISINTSDAMLFSNAGGGYTFDANFTSSNYTAVNLLTACATNAGALDFSAGSKTLTVADNATIGLDLNALEGLSSTGLVARTAANSYSERTITGTAAQVTVTNGDGVSGNPTLSLPDTFNIDTSKLLYSPVQDSLYVTDLKVDGTITIDDFTDATLDAIKAYNTNGLITQTSQDNFTGRTITGTANEITVSNGDGVSGNPALSLPDAVTLGTNGGTSGGLDFVASDNDQGDVDISTDDELEFSNFAGGYQFDQQIFGNIEYDKISVGLDDAHAMASDTLWFFENDFQATMTLDSIFVRATTDDQDVNIIVSNRYGGGIAVVDAITASTDGTGEVYTQTETTLTTSSITAGQVLGLTKPTVTSDNILVSIYYHVTKAKR